MRLGVLLVFSIALSAAAGARAQVDEVLALDQRVADAVVRGDTAYVDSVTADDFVMVHGDGWTRGGEPLLVDGKEALLERTASRYYDVLGFDSVQAELHGDIAITHGRYAAKLAASSDPARAWFFIWYERVYAKRNGQWVYLSHRTVRGPTFSDGVPPAPAPRPAPAADENAEEVLALEREIGAAIVRGDAQYFDEITSQDFVMVHGDGWTSGGAPALVDDKAAFMQRVASRAYAVHDYYAQAAEMHGDVAITYGRYVGYIPGSPPERRWFHVGYQKVYAKRGGRWTYVSHRTVDGAHYAESRMKLGVGRSGLTRLEFMPDTPAYEYAAKAYRDIWSEYGERILAALEARSCLKFAEPAVSAIVHDASSHSGGPEHPMGLRATYATELKQSTLVHELGHRHLWQLAERLEGVDGHRTLYLILDRVWADVWGEEFAAARIRSESEWEAEYDYASAWTWAQTRGPAERARLWNELLTRNGVTSPCGGFGRVAGAQ